jgi:hypothetical protein
LIVLTPHRFGFLLAFACWFYSLIFMEQLNVSGMLELQRAFVSERKWQKFHTPKNLSMALVREAAELMEIFQWLSQAESEAEGSESSVAPLRLARIWGSFNGYFNLLRRIPDSAMNSLTGSGCGSVVECGLPKPEMRVRFPSPAPLFLRGFLMECSKSAVKFTIPILL